MRACALERTARHAAWQLGWEIDGLVIADSFACRLMGMGAPAFRSTERQESVLVFPDCRAVHTCFMTRLLDIAFVDEDGAVISCYERVAAWRFMAEPRAALVLERFSREREREREKWAEVMVPTCAA